MKKGIILLLMSLFLFFAVSVQAYTVTVTDDLGDAIGNAFETTQITYVDTVGSGESGPSTVTIYTVYDKAGGLLIGGWQTRPADLIFEGANTTDTYVVPLVDHHGFTAGTLYTATDFYTSDNIADNYNTTGLSWNVGQNVWMKTGEQVGSGNYTGSFIFGGDTTDTTDNGTITYNANWHWNNSNGNALSLSWATATCANDVIGNLPDPVATPVPGTLSLLALGLIGFAGISRRKKE